MRTLGKKLKEARKKLGLKQVDVAKKANIRIMVEPRNHWWTYPGSDRPVCRFRRGIQQCPTFPVWTDYRLHIWARLRRDAVAGFKATCFSIVDWSNLCSLGHLLGCQSFRIPR